MKSLIKSSSTVFLFIALPAAAQQNDAMVLNAKQAGQIGEQADGFLGAVGKPTAETLAILKYANVRRDQVYKGKVEEYRRRLGPSGALSLDQVIKMTTCNTFENMIYNTRYKSSDGIWRIRQAGKPVVMPNFCPFKLGGSRP